MNNIEYFKLQAKNLYKDWKSREQKYFVFNVKDLFRIYNVKIDERPTLMKAQHLLAQALGRNKWADLLTEPDEKLSYTRNIMEEEWQDFKEAECEDEYRSDDINENDGYTGEVECLHCGQRFPIDKPNHLPSCDGEEWDLVPVEELD
ncbi:MAG TPA: hypothetical protein IAD29_06480 [Candidatus Scatocola faecigallinarum]|nr:MAG TPA: zinc-ribbon containing domain protein [Caudoviricetes sp.]HIV08076.1 hypothetical protein [Candidatus Scatocola faecigallinarum]